MSQAPLISVIVPVYNTEKYLRKCLDSICGQTYRNLEIICVNDGSPDNSATILEEYAARDERIKVLTQPNAGLAAARNAGLAFASGEWVTGVDSDDYLELDAYEYAINAATPDVDIVCFGTRLVWKGVKYNEAYEKSFTQPFIGITSPNPELIAKTHVAFWNKLWRRSFIEHYQCRFPVGLWYEDFFFWRALAPFAKHIAYLSDTKINYVRQPESIMSQSGSTNPKTLDHAQIIDRLLKYYERYNLPWANGKLDAFIFSYQCALVDTSPELYPQLSDKYHSIAVTRGLQASHASALRFLKPTSKFANLFSRHLPGKSTYSIAGIRLFTVQYRYGKRIKRLLGIKF